MRTTRRFHVKHMHDLSFTIKIVELLQKAVDMKAKSDYPNEEKLL